MKNQEKRSGIKLDKKVTNKEMDHKLSSLILKNENHKKALVNFIAAYDEHLIEKSGRIQKNTKKIN
ncbi:MAG: hypothetical protein GQ527_11870 [Bacteroidales bacterium]|nr:hypothetical protein [Bacteroidales bacterium]